MFTITLHDKVYKVPYVTALALREVKAPLELMDAMEKDPGRALTAAEMDMLVKWFCIFAGNQMTPEDVYKHYPADQLINDIHVAALSVQQATTAVFQGFPLPPAMRSQAAGGT